MRKYSTMGVLELWYSTIKDTDILDALDSSAREGAIRVFAKARGATHMQVLGKLADLVDEKYKLRMNAPFIVRQTHTEAGRPVKEALGLLLESYFLSLADDRKNLLKNYRVVDVARKIVGVGSVGTRCWIMFLTGNTNEDPLFIQVKEAQPSVLEPYLNPSVYKQHGQRVVEGQRLIQGAPDIFLGWGNQDGKHFYVRQLRDMKGGLDIEPGKVKVKNLPQYGTLCGWALALAHAKSGDAAMLAGYMGQSDELDEAMAEYAFAYNDQNDRDYIDFKNAIKNGTLKSTKLEAGERQKKE
jgi:uncharacterized protein (DUF2252 family)